MLWRYWWRLCQTIRRLLNVHAFYQRLNPSIQIIGTGGVKTGRDAFEHILCGASMVQLGTILHQEGPEVF